MIEWHPDFTLIFNSFIKQCYYITIDSIHLPILPFQFCGWSDASEPMDYFKISQRSRRRQWHPTPVLLTGKSHGWRSLVGCSPRGRKESDTTEQLHFHFSLSCIGEGNGNPLQCSCLENPRDSGAWWAAVYGVAQSRTRLKRLSITKEYHIKFRFFKSLWRNQTFILIFTPSQNPYRNKNVKSIDMKRVGEEIITDELSINFKHRKTDEWLNDLTGKKKLKFKSIVLKANKIFQIQA